MPENLPILLEHAGPVSTLVVNRPNALNTLNPETLHAMRAAITELRARLDLGCLVLAGAGDRAFSAGADINMVSRMSASDAVAFAELGQATLADLEALEVPVIAVVDGFALGGGCELALACDFIYAGPRARFGLPEVKLGVVPAFGGTQRLSRRVALGVARELIYTGKTIGPEEALRIGLINAVYESDVLIAKAHETAACIAARGPQAVTEAKRVINRGVDLPLAEALACEVRAFAACFGAEQREGTQAFLAKRPARFRRG